MRKTKLLLLFCLMWAGQWYQAQAQDYFQVHGYKAMGSAENKFFHSVQASDGSYYACGYYNATADVPILAKYNADGSLAWMESYNADGYFDNIIIDHNGDIVVTGMFEGSVNTYFDILKLNASNGSVKNSMYYDYVSSSSYSEGFSVIETQSGSTYGYLAVGDIANGSNDAIMVVATDGNLNSSLQQMISQSGTDCNGVTVVQKASNDYVLYGNIGNSLYVREFDGTGSVVAGGADNTYTDFGGHHDNLFPQSMKKVSGGYLLTGDDFSTGTPSCFALAVKLDNSFNVSWATSYANGSYTSGRDITTDASGNCVIAALEGNFITLIKASSTGSWVSSTGYENTGYYSEPFGLMTAADGYFEIAGFSNNSTGSWTQQYFNLTKADGTNSGSCNHTPFTNSSNASLAVSANGSGESVSTLSGDNPLSISGSSISPTSTICKNCNPPSSIALTMPSGGCSANGPNPVLTATSIPAAYYQWYEGSTLMATTTTNTWAANADGGTYHVVVSFDPTFATCTTTSGSVTTYNTFNAITANLTTSGSDAWTESGACTGYPGAYNFTLGDNTNWSLSSEYTPDPFDPGYMWDFSTGAGYTVAVDWGDGSAQTTYSNPALYTVFGSSATPSHLYSSVSSVTTYQIYVYIYDLSNPSECPSKSVAYSVTLYPPPTGLSASLIDICSPAFDNTSMTKKRILKVSATMQSTGTFTVSNSTSTYGPISFSLIPSSDPTYHPTYSGGVLTNYYYITNPEYSAGLDIKAYNQNDCYGSSLLTYNLGSINCLNNTNDYPGWAQIIPYDIYVDVNEPAIDLRNAINTHGVTIGGSAFSTPAVSGDFSTSTGSAVTGNMLNPGTSGLVPYIGSHLDIDYTINAAPTLTVPINCSTVVTKELYVYQHHTLITPPTTICPNSTATYTCTVSGMPTGTYAPQGVIAWYAVSTDADYDYNHSSLTRASGYTYLSGASTVSSFAVPTSSATTQYYVNVIIYQYYNSYWQDATPNAQYRDFQTITVTPNNMNIAMTLGGSVVSGTQHVCPGSVGNISANVTLGSSNVATHSYTASWYLNSTLDHTVSLGTFSSTAAWASALAFTPTSMGTWSVHISEASGACGPVINGVTLVSNAPTATITGTLYACTGSTTTLGVSVSPSGTSVQWFAAVGGVATGPVLSAMATYNAAPGSYIVEATYSGCSGYSTAVTVNTPPALTLSTAPYVGPPTNTTISVNVPTGFTGYSSVTVHSGNPGFTPVTLTSGGSWATNVPAGYYWVTYQVCGSTTQTTNMVKVGPDCTTYVPYSWSPGAITSSVSLSASTSYFSAGTLTIASGGHLTIGSTNTLVMGPGTEIDIQAGGELTLNGGTIIGCSQWRGIDVQGSGTLVTAVSGGVSPLISDAITAVYSENGGSLNIVGCTFINNVNHITIAPYSSNHGSYVEDCIFGNLIVSSAYSSFYTHYKNTYPCMVYLEGVKGLYFGDISSGSGSQNAFTAPEGSSTMNATAIAAYNLTGSPTGSSAINIKSSNAGVSGDYGNTFDGPFISCISNNGIPVGGTATLSTGLNIVQNKFGKSGSSVHPVTGIAFSMTDNSYIGDNNINDANDMENMTNAITFYQDITSGATGSLIQGNQIENNSYGIVIAPDQYPVTTVPVAPGGAINGSSNIIELTMACNRIGGNGIGIVGTGKISAQGSGSSSVANQFVPTTFVSHNTLADLFWNWSGSGGITYSSLLGASGSTPTTSLSPAIYMNNTSTPLTSTSGYTPTSSPSNGCPNFYALTDEKGEHVENVPGKSGTEGKGSILANIGSGIATDVVVYPNPTSGLFNIAFTNPDGQNWTLDVFDMVGKTVYKGNLSVSQTQSIDAATWSSGVYRLRFVNTQGNVIEKQVVVQK